MIGPYLQRRIHPGKLDKDFRPGTAWSRTTGRLKRDGASKSAAYTTLQHQYAQQSAVMVRSKAGMALWGEKSGGGTGELGQGLRARRAE